MFNINIKCSKKTNTYNNLFNRDPIPNKLKNLIIIYLDIKNVKREISLKENSDIIIFNILNIITAYYGLKNDYLMDVTSKVKSFLTQTPTLTKKLNGKNFYIGSRVDRYGSNCCKWIPALFYSQIKNGNLNHVCSKNCNKYKNSLIHTYLVNNSSQSKSGKHLMNKNFLTYGINEIIADNNFISFPDIFYNSLTHKNIVNLYNQTCVSKKWNVPDDLHNSIVIHIRLGDRRNILEGSHPRQVFIGEKLLVRLITYLHEKFKNFSNIYLLFHQNDADIKIINSIIFKNKLTNVKIIGNSDIDNDIYIMIKAGLLVMSKSTFALIGGLLSIKDTVYTYSPWSHYNELIGTKSINTSKKFKVLKY